MRDRNSFMRPLVFSNCGGEFLICSGWERDIGFEHRSKAAGLSERPETVVLKQKINKSLYCHPPWRGDYLLEGHVGSFWNNFTRRPPRLCLPGTSAGKHFSLGPVPMSSEKPQCAQQTYTALSSHLPGSLTRTWAAAPRLGLFPFGLSLLSLGRSVCAHWVSHLPNPSRGTLTYLKETGNIRVWNYAVIALTLY